MADRLGIILLTGPPGVGKTTLIIKICEELISKHKMVCNGFYTEEVRDPTTRERIGFDVVTLNKKRGILARSGIKGKGPFVGKYCVYIKDFEDFTLPLLNTSENQDLLVIDEVGKMELKSKKFELAVTNCLTNTCLMATIPYESRQHMPLLDKLKSHSKAHVFVVTKENRNHLQNKIVEEIFKITEK